MSHYGKLTDEQKEQYSLSKVKTARYLFVLSFAIIIVLGFIYGSLLLYPFGRTLVNILFCTEIIIFLILNFTSVLLNVFVKNSCVRYRNANYTELIETSTGGKETVNLC